VEEKVTSVPTTSYQSKSEKAKGSNNILGIGKTRGILQPNRHNKKPQTMQVLRVYRFSRQNKYIILRTTRNAYCS
jgi:hypothetical protein